jgi:hypothetical protein
MIVPTANRFFTDYKKFDTKIKSLDKQLIEYQVKYLVAEPAAKVGYHHSEHETSTIYFSYTNNVVEDLARVKKGVIYFNEGFIFGLLGDRSIISEEEIKKFVEEHKHKDTEVKFNSKTTVSVGKKKIENIYQFSVFHRFSIQVVTDFFKNRSGFVKI